MKSHVGGGFSHLQRSPSPHYPYGTTIQTVAGSSWNSSRCPRNSSLKTQNHLYQYLNQTEELSSNRSPLEKVVDCIARPLECLQNFRLFHVQSLHSHYINCGLMRDHTSHNRIFLFFTSVTMLLRVLSPRLNINCVEAYIKCLGLRNKKYNPDLLSAHGSVGSQSNKLAFTKQVGSAASVGRKEGPGRAGETICFLRRNWRMGTASRQREQLVHWPGGLMACSQKRRGGAWECDMSLTRKGWVMEEPKSHDKELELCYIWTILNLTWDANDSGTYGYCFLWENKSTVTHTFAHIFIFYIQFRDLHGPPLQHPAKLFPPT